MSSERRIAANRRNARKSTGPKTPEGKRAVRSNALKDGLYARQVLLPGEDEDDFKALRRDFFDQHQPLGRAESALVDRLVVCTWRLHRTVTLEADIFSSTLNDKADYLDEYHPDCDLGEHLAVVYGMTSETLDKVYRQEARLDRSFYKALHELQRLQAARQGQRVPLPQVIEIHSDPDTPPPGPHVASSDSHRPAAAPASTAPKASASAASPASPPPPLAHSPCCPRSPRPSGDSAGAEPGAARCESTLHSPSPRSPKPSPGWVCFSLFLYLLGMLRLMSTFCRRFSGRPSQAGFQEQVRNYAGAGWKTGGGLKTGMPTG